MSSSTPNFVPAHARRINPTTRNHPCLDGWMELQLQLQLQLDDKCTATEQHHIDFISLHGMRVTILAVDGATLCNRYGAHVNGGREDLPGKRFCPFVSRL